MVPETASIQILEFALSESSHTRDSVLLLRLNNLFCESFDRSDHGDVGEILSRELKHGQRFFIAVEDGTFIAFASWHPDGEARNGTGELRYIGWFQGVPGTTVVPALLNAVEGHAARWFAERKQSRLRKLFAKIPAHRVGARVALEASGFRVEATLPKDIDNATDALYLGKYYPEPEAL